MLAGLRLSITSPSSRATPLELIQEVRPDVLVKGADYRDDEVVGADFVESYGGRVHLVPLREGMSSSRHSAQVGCGVTS